MMTLSDEEASRISNSKIKPESHEFIRSAPDDAKQILAAWYFDGAKIQYSGKINPTEDDWNDYTKSEFPVKNTFVQYKWRMKPDTVKKCRLALMKANGVVKPLLVEDYEFSLVFMNLQSNEIFIRWLTDWIEYEEPQ